MDRLEEIGFTRAVVITTCKTIENYNIILANALACLVNPKNNMGKTTFLL